MEQAIAEGETPRGGGGGGSEAKKKFVPKIGLEFPAPLKFAGGKFF